MIAQKFNLNRKFQPVLSLRIALKLSSWADNISLKNRAITSAAILLFLFVTDLHRYGAWYFGNATYIKPYWFQFVCLLWGFIGLYLLSKIMRWLESREQYQYMQMIIVYPFMVIPYAFLHNSFNFEFYGAVWKQYPDLLGQIASIGWWTIVPIGVAYGIADGYGKVRE